jgi:wyosine [tRNA(Phe)-imidazoG37] synthetase (radical SAM superfamily)
MKMKYVYGPVPSRRLGQSLGIDPIPFKTCNWNCVYCQLGRTSPLINERRDYFPPEEIVAEVMAAVQAHQPGQIDWITFVGSGEPTLHASLGAMIRQLKTAVALPIAVITNGSLLYRPEVRQELMAADAVLPTLDAGTEVLYQKINRPMPELDFERFVQGLVDFRRQYTGKLWVEVMLVAGLNDSEQALEDLAVVLRRIRPDEVHVNSPVRSACEPWVRPTDDAGLARAASILGEVCRVVRPAEGWLDLSGFDNLVDAIVAVITRHPISEEELVAALDRWNPGHVRESLEKLEQSGRAQVVIRDGKRFWSCAEARYVDETLSRRHENPSLVKACSGPLPKVETDRLPE